MTNANRLRLVVRTDAFQEGKPVGVANLFACLGMALVLFDKYHDRARLVKVTPGRIRCPSGNAVEKKKGQCLTQRGVTTASRKPCGPSTSGRWGMRRGSVSWC